MSTEKHFPTAEQKEKELVITRTFDAPRKLVFKAWTESEHMARWWSPKGFTIPHCKIDFRVGGAWHLCMRSPSGEDFWCGGVYREIIEPELIVCTDHFADREGNIVDPSEYGMPGDFPKEMLITVILTEQDGKTTLTMCQSVPKELAEKTQMSDGWNQLFDKLAEFLETL